MKKKFFTNLWLTFHSWSPNITDFLSVNNQSELSIFLYFHTFYSVAFLLQFFKHFMHNHAIL
ncbi:hypothetical protein ROSINTL182_06770 [Roseburia intestinalis L1-82]|uniref:Uncharacterized protein n=1 Tax=Roseburia intestinalis L1-82 TaxID=536231 RepID=C7GA18_9FIRM|nr:hypothetical protein ROSINTL182_06770 [Roseburia intestinalis L1-82]